MPDRTTAKEVSVDLAGFKSSVDKQFAGVDKQINLVSQLARRELRLARHVQSTRTSPLSNSARYTRNIGRV